MNTLVVEAEAGSTQISRHVYGHFAEHLGRCIYEGFWIGGRSDISATRGLRDDVVEALRAVRIPNLRWPGGCFADEYHWRDGIGPRAHRPYRVNSHWGGVLETNNFGTHEFMDLCHLLGCEPYICGNVGAGTPQEMKDWIEYLTFDGATRLANTRSANGRERPWRVRFWGVGNENWGCGGSMKPEYYANEYRRFQQFCHNYSGNELFKIACGPPGDDTNWTEVLMREAKCCMDGLALHYYAFGAGWAEKGPATGFDEKHWFKLLESGLRMDAVVAMHKEVMDRHDPEKRVALVVDEWGAWYDPTPGTNPGFLEQQNTVRDALLAGATLNIFNNHADRVRVANLAQTVNVLQAMILTNDRAMILTPTYHVFDMYKDHQDAMLTPTQLDCVPYEFEGESIPALNASASRDAQGRLLVTLCNLHPREPQELAVEIRGMTPGETTATVLTADAMDACNDFDTPHRVRPAEFDGVALQGNGLRLSAPPRSVLAVRIAPEA